jgi:hypothetical protein
MVVLELRLLVPNKITAERAAKLVNDMLDIGMADAQETLEDPHNENEDAKDVVKLVLTEPKVLREGGA